MTTQTSVMAAHASVANPELVIQGTPLHDAVISSSYDAIVIGSGIGGLTAAVGLAKFGGQRVLVLEQHYTAGGFTHAFRRGKFAWNVGVHYVGCGIGEPGGQLYAPFNAFTGGKVPWVKLPHVHDRLVIGERIYDIVTGRDAWLEKMTEYFPQERQALVAWLELLDAAESSFMKANSTRGLPDWLAWLIKPFTSGSVSEWAKLAGQSLKELLDDITQDPELKAVLGGAWPDVGLSPVECSAGYYLVVYKSFLDGAYVPAGGASHIAAAMIPSIEAAGGAVVTSADVEQIIVEGGRAVGVRLADGREISAKTVISNAGIVNTFTHLLSPDVLATNPEMQQQLQQAAAAGSSISTVIVYVGLEEPHVPEFEGFGTLRLYPTGDHDLNRRRFLQDPEAPLPLVEICCCSHGSRLTTDLAPAGAVVSGSAHTTGLDGPVDSGDGKGSSSSAVGQIEGGGTSTLQVMSAANYDWFKDWAGTEWHKRGDGYEAFKQHMRDRLMQKLGEVFPKMPGRIACTEVSTPLSTEHFSRWPKGSIYGIQAAPERYSLTGGFSWGPATPVPGLLLTGQDLLGDGVTSAFFAGTLAAQKAGGLWVTLGMFREMLKWM